MNCELLEGCAFFNTLNGIKPDAIVIFQEVYCNSTPALCARWQVARAVGRERVPPTLKPNETHLVQGIIDAVLSEQ
ncbi:MAG: hypothetical protein WC047_04670 [Kiritimatiellales bacterium]